MGLPEEGQCVFVWPEGDALAQPADGNDGSHSAESWSLSFSVI